MLSSVNEFVRLARKQLALSQEALGRRIGVTRKTVMRYENGSKVPTRSLLAIKELLNRRGIKIRHTIEGVGAWIATKNFSWDTERWEPVCWF